MKLDPLTKPRRKRKNEVLYHKLLQGKLDHLSQEEKKLIEPVLLKYMHVFHDDETNYFRGTEMVEHQILVEYMGCLESFRTFKIARHCVNLAGRGKCYSLVMSLTNCIAKTALPYLA